MKAAFQTALLSSLNMTCCRVISVLQFRETRRKALHRMWLENRCQMLHLYSLDSSSVSDQTRCYTLWYIAALSHCDCRPLTPKLWPQRLYWCLSVLINSEMGCTFYCTFQHPRALFQGPLIHPFTPMHINEWLKPCKRLWEQLRLQCLAQGHINCWDFNCRTFNQKFLAHSTADPQLHKQHKILQYWRVTEELEAWLLLSKTHSAVERDTGLQ